MNAIFHTRRNFLKGSAAALALASLRPSALAQQETPPAARAPRPLKRAIMWGTVSLKGTTLEKMKAIKAAGFQGTEMMSHMDQDEVMRARDETGLTIPSVCGKHHWKKPLSDPDPKIREEGLKGLKQCLRDAKRYGASSVLLVPGVVKDGADYEQCWTRSIAEIRKAIPVAEETGVKIAIENVWNNFITKPAQAAAYLEAINSPWVGWHFDIGNVLKYSPSETWIPVLGKQILKLHVKEYSKTKGFNVPLLEGDDNWPAIMKALDKIGYAGWAITEQPGGDSPEGLKDLNDRLLKILAS